MTPIKTYAEHLAEQVEKMGRANPREIRDWLAPTERQTPALAKVFAAPYKGEWRETRMALRMIPNEVMQLAGKEYSVLLDALEAVKTHLEAEQLVAASDAAEDLIGRLAGLLTHHNRPFPKENYGVEGYERKNKFMEPDG